MTSFPYKDVIIKDVAGIVRHYRVSTDPRGIACDGGPAGFNRSFRASKDTLGNLPVGTKSMSRDEEGGDLPNEIDATFALRCMKEIVDRVTDVDQRRQLSEGMVQLMDSMTPENDNTGEDAGTEYPVRPGYVPAASGKTVGKLQMDAALKARRTLAAQDSAFKMFPDLAKIRLGGR